MKRVFFCLLLFLCLFFANIAFGNQPRIVISEINAAAVKELEWIELVNIHDDPVDMTDWTFFEDDTHHRLSLVQGSSTIQTGEYVVIAQDAGALLGTINLGSTTVFDSSWGSLKERGEAIAIIDADGLTVEEFSYVTSTETSLERVDLAEQDYSNQNWRAHPHSHSLGAANHWLMATSIPPVEDPLDDEPDRVLVTSTADIIISEVLSHPVGGSEWVELFNAGTSTAQLTNWELHDGKGVISLLSIEIPSSSYYVIDLASSKLNNGGDTVLLKDDDGAIIDHMSYGNWDDAVVGSPDKAESMVLLGSQWYISASTTPGEANVLSEDVEVPEVVADIVSSIESDTLYINEVVSDPTDNAVEFVELYYIGAETVSLAGLTLEDGSETETKLSGNIEPKGYVVIESPKGKLNNSGDHIRLLDSAGSLIDQLTYGNWDDGNTADNAVVAKDPYSLSRKSTTGNNFTDFVVSTQVTPGEGNEIIEEIVLSTGESIETYRHVDIMISEVFPNPEGSDSEREFIELYNRENSDVSLKGWKLGDASKKRYTFDAETISGNTYMTVYRSDSGIALNNSGAEEVKLFDPSGTLHASMSYSGTVPEEESYIEVEDGWQWTTLVTPNKENVLEQIITPPVIAVSVPLELQFGETLSLDASDSYSDSGGKLHFLWQMGDGRQHTRAAINHQYETAGRYQIDLLVSDPSGASSSESYDIHVFEPTGIVEGASTSSWQYLQLSEVVPNPKGSDSAEYIELYNAGLTDLSLAGLQIDDAEGGSKPYKLPDVTIPPLNYYLVTREDSGIALNNSGDSVRFLQQDGEELYRIDYEGSIEDSAYVPDELGNWIWTTALSPGTINVIDEVDVAIAGTKKKKKSENPVIHTTVAGARQQDVGDMVRVYGVVSVLPGVLGSQYFYIDHEESGIQVYMHKKEFPVLSIGQGIVVTGEIGSSQGDVRIKIKDASQIQQQDQPGLQTTSTISILDLTQHLGALVSIQGEVTEVKSSYFYLDDGDEEVKVYLKKGAGIPKKYVSVGDLVTMLGIVIQAKHELRVLPRAKEDINVTGVAELAAVERKEAAAHNDREVAEKYLTATAGGITSLLFGLIAKVHGSAAVRRLRYVQQLVKK